MTLFEFAGSGAASATAQYRIGDGAALPPPTMVATATPLVDIPNIPSPLGSVGFIPDRRDPLVDQDSMSLLHPESRAELKAVYGSLGLVGMIEIRNECGSFIRGVTVSVVSSHCPAIYFFRLKCKCISHGPCSCCRRTQSRSRSFACWVRTGFNWSMIKMYDCFPFEIIRVS